MIFLVRTLCQVMVLYIFSLAGNFLTNLMQLKIPGSMIGILLVLILLQLKIIPLEWLETGANWLLSELLLFFIPSAVGVVRYEHLITSQAISFLIIIVASTLLVMSGAGLTAELITILRKEKAKP